MSEDDRIYKNTRTEFDRRKLERCMRHSIRTNDRKSKYIKRKKKKDVPYWNIWRAVFAGGIFLVEFFFIFLLGV